MWDVLFTLRDNESSPVGRTVPRRTLDALEKRGLFKWHTPFTGRLTEAGAAAVDGYRIGRGQG